MVDCVRTERNAALLQLPHLGPDQTLAPLEGLSLVADEGGRQVDRCGKAEALKDRLRAFDKIPVAIVESDGNLLAVDLAGF